jgi:hypothetical protein
MEEAADLFDDLFAFLCPDTDLGVLLGVLDWCRSVVFCLAFKE